MAKAKRKKISKKVRFEIFKRDYFKCAYCGQTPPAIVLEIDHICPVSKGGTNDINNLITACRDCNRGKTNIPLSSLPNTLVENLEELKEKEAQLKAHRSFILGIKRREKKDIKDVVMIFEDSFEDIVLTKKFKNVSIATFLKKLPKNDVEESMEKACAIIDEPEEAARYFCGICWNKIKNGCKNE